MTAEESTHHDRPRRPVPGELRGRAQRAIRAQRPPTVPIGIRGDDNGLTEWHSRAVIDLALRVGETMLATGASASDVTATVLRLTRAYDVRSLHVDVTYTSITISYHRGVMRDPLTVMRIVPALAADYGRLEAIHTLVRDIVDEPGEIGAAQDRLEAILAMHHPYRRGVVTLAIGLLGAAITALLAGSIVLILLSFVVSMVIDRVQRFISLRGVSAFFTQAVGAAIPTTVVVLLWTLVPKDERADLGLHSLSALVATTIVVLLSGLGVVSAALETLDGYYLTSAARTFEVVILSVGVATGITTVLAIGQRLDPEMLPFTAASANITPNLLLGVVASGVIAAAHSVASYTGLRGALFAMGVAAFSWLMYWISNIWAAPTTWFDTQAQQQPNGSDHGVLAAIPATFVAAVVAGAVAQLVAVRYRVPALAVTTAAIIPLLPGLSLFNGIFQLVHSASDPSKGVASLITAAALGLALAGGISLGGLPVRLLRADRVQKRILRRAVADTRD
ncbi:threonine/serine exporter family protein [Luteipulveratus flavus]|uniref:Threonine/serine exporter family protein n=1 Tax=Luteipulveratus flavus TaxID=3031728 RepID=A0ABT6C7X4_9MICO|nr:threonine/serine exporter family protein [Luteipulveratus sp. YIM 133296]MDF8265012.1 threonine/serine exporter family protein [Luteipulveratus sp. YIM 133296]